MAGGGNVEVEWKDGTHTKQPGRQVLREAPLKVRE